jgi:hypothetical protein
MKKMIWLPITALVFFAGDRLGGYWLNNMVKNSQFRYSRLYHAAEAADVILLGNSRGLTFYQPEIERLTGATTINLSYNGLPMDLGKALVEDYLDRHKAKLLVVDVSICERKNVPLISAFRTYAPQSPRISQLLRGYDATDFWATQWFHLYRYNSEVSQRAFFYRHQSK